MSSATNIEATAVNTVAWLSADDTTIVVPVYQRQYRWDIGGCEQLLGDIRAVADADERQTHFIGSILSTGGEVRETASSTELVLIDGQQRITTLMLLVAALHHTAELSGDVELAGELEKVLVTRAAGAASGGPHTEPVHTAPVHTEPVHTKLRPHRAWAEVFEGVVLNRRGDELGESRFDDNYAFFRSQIRADEVGRIWRGLKRLEHVAITLGSNANAQQIFESLNSTGEPLRDHELIHNYVLMGLSHAEQSEIEESYWLPIEQNTGEQIGSFWRHYLVMLTGREVAVAGERGVYDAFRAQFPRLDLASLRSHAASWRAYSVAYRTLLNPASAPDAAVAAQLAWLNTFGRGMYPLIMSTYYDHTAGLVSRESVIATLEHVQALQLRRTIAGLSNDRLVARLCRARAVGPSALVRAIARITPSDERVRVALRFAALPHPAYVLGRIAAAAGPVDASVPFDVVHVFPLAPSDEWSGGDIVNGGARRWADYTDDEQNSHRALAETIGNLALLEQPLAERAFDLSFPAARPLYSSSSLASTRSVGAVPTWGTAAIAARTAELTALFLRVWERPLPAADGSEDGSSALTASAPAVATGDSPIGGIRTAGGAAIAPGSLPATAPAAGGSAPALARVLIDDDGLAPILDAVRRRGWPRGWQREFEYVEYRGEHWEVYDVKYLFNRIFKRLWADDRAAVVAFSDRRGGPVYDSQAWNGHWDALDDSHFLYMGWDSKYMLTAIQGVLDEAGLSSDVFVKYSYVAALM